MSLKKFQSRGTRYVVWFYFFQSLHTWKKRSTELGIGTLIIGIVIGILASFAYPDIAVEINAMIHGIIDNLADGIRT